MTDTICLVLGLVLIIEGIGPALFPNRWKNYLLRITKESTSNLRTLGLVMLIFGIIFLYLAN
ncbi:MAG: DUF2065 domain-containing protein [Litorilituus sp.]|jgi:hypothetical protein|nr:DUF2065 domain-containing protein [Litorilituus sp.]